MRSYRMAKGQRQAASRPRISFTVKLLSLVSAPFERFCRQSGGRVRSVLDALHDLDRGSTAPPPLLTCCERGCRAKAQSHSAISRRPRLTASREWLCVIEKMVDSRCVVESSRSCHPVMLALVERIYRALTNRPVDVQRSSPRTVARLRTLSRSSILRPWMITGSLQAIQRPPEVDAIEMSKH